MILVGEIRDQETADIALGAAQTGHLLLSTLHTNDAPATITRLFDLGIQPFLIASSLLGIVAQRLVRRPCPACAAPQLPSDETIEKIGGPSRLPPDGQWVAGQGCDQCGQSGLQGTNRHPRGAGHQRRGARADFEPRDGARHQKGGAAGRHADAARRRHRQGRPGSHHARRSAPRRVSRRREPTRSTADPSPGGGPAVGRRSGGPGEPALPRSADACSSSKTARRSCRW